jgi:3',5'-cyclic AMP phosphodiesterase CpdA
LSSGSNLLLWVSDPHFSEQHHGFKLVSDAYGWDLSKAIREDLESFCGAKEVAGVIISGDLTWKADAQEFELARSFINSVRSWATLQDNSFVLCPGNHDLAYVNEPWKKGEPPTVAPEEAVKNFATFYQNLYTTKANEWFCSGRRFLIANAKAVDVVSLNSSLLMQTAGAFQGQGFLGEDQLLYAAKSMGWRQRGSGPRAFRIVVLHHHVVPIIHRELPAYEQQSSVVYDAGALCKWLEEHEVDLVLHGHMHQATIVKEARSPNLRANPVQWHEFTIAALGSSGVKLDHTTDHKNSYGLLEFGRSAVTLTLRQISPNNSVAEGDKIVGQIQIPYRS